MMEERLISFETAKLAKRKGFDVPCTKFSYDNDRILTDRMMRMYSEEDVFYERPTQSILQTWLRDIHDIKLCVSWIENKLDDISYYLYEVNHKQYSVGGYDSYEEALEDGLQYALKLIN